MDTSVFPALHAANLDRAAHAMQARLSHGMSPTSLWLAFFDWGIHLALSPGKQMELIDKAQRKTARYLRAWASCNLQGQSTPCIEPLPQDERFSHPSWQHWPYNAIYQAFLLQQQWWHNATSDVRGLAGHHQDVVNFQVRQLLDMCSPSNFLATNPEVLDATWLEMGANLLRGAAKWRSDQLRQLSGEADPRTQSFRPGEHVAVTPGKVVARNELMELIQYAPTCAQVRPEPILIVPSWIMKYYILDLSPHNSMVRWLTDQGHTVFILSWRNPTADDAQIGMDDYLRLGPLAALAAVHAICPPRRHGKVHAVGYCLGGTLLAIAAAKLARDGEDGLASLSLLAAETDFSEPGELSLFIDASQITYLEDVMWDQGYLDGKQMGGTFTWLHSRDLIWSRMVREYLLGLDQPLNDLMAWNADTTRMPYRMHAEYLRSLYLENRLANGNYLVGGRPVALNDITVPTFVVGTAKDHVSPWRSVYKFQLLCDAEVTFVLTSGGHNAGIVSEPGHKGRSYQLATRAAHGKYVDPDTWLATAPRFEGSWWTAWQQWLVAHSGEPIKPPALGASGRGYPPLEAAPGRYVHLT